MVKVKQQIPIIPISYWEVQKAKVMKPKKLEIGLD
jgi:hypothetical protein